MKIIINKFLPFFKGRFSGSVTINSAPLPMLPPASMLPLPHHSIYSKDIALSLFLYASNASPLAINP